MKDIFKKNKIALLLLIILIIAGTIILGIKGFEKSPDLKAGTIKSVMFYTSDGSNYILFDTVCTLNIKVNK